MVVKYGTTAELSRGTFIKIHTVSTVDCDAHTLDKGLRQYLKTQFVIVTLS